MATYLGFDSSTQSLTATVIEITGRRAADRVRARPRVRRRVPGVRHHATASSCPATTDGPSPRRRRCGRRRSTGWPGILAAGVDLSSRPRHHRLRAAARQRLPHGRRRRDAARARSRRGRSPIRSAGCFSRPRVPGVDGLQHDRGVRQPDGGPGWRRGARAADRVARLRTFHRRADPEVRVHAIPPATRAPIGFIW